jgi:hypothetical protein
MPPDLGANVMAGYSFQGVSGRHYTYGLLDPQAPNRVLPISAGNFVFAKASKSNPEPVFIGETERFRTFLRQMTLWHTAQTDHRANLLYFHLSLGDEPSRKDEVLDLVKRYRPPMNVPDTAGIDQE